MSTSHHESSTPEEAEAKSRLLDQFLGRAKPNFPRGRINSNDEGELAFAIALDPSRKIVVLRFGKPVDWLGLGKAEAEHMAKLLLEKASQL